MYYLQSGKEKNKTQSENFPGVLFLFSQFLKKKRKQSHSYNCVLFILAYLFYTTQTFYNKV